MILEVFLVRNFITAGYSILSSEFKTTVSENIKTILRIKEGAVATSPYTDQTRFEWLELLASITKNVNVFCHILKEAEINIVSIVLLYTYYVENKNISKRGKYDYDSLRQKIVT